MFLCCGCSAKWAFLWGGMDRYKQSPATDEQFHKAMLILFNKYPGTHITVEILKTYYITNDTLYSHR